MRMEIDTLVNSSGQSLGLNRDLMTESRKTRENLDGGVPIIDYRPSNEVEASLFDVGLTVNKDSYGYASSPGKRSSMEDFYGTQICDVDDKDVDCKICAHDFFDKLFVQGEKHVEWSEAMGGQYPLKPISSGSDIIMDDVYHLEKMLGITGLVAAGGRGIVDIVVPNISTNYHEYDNSKKTFGEMIVRFGWDPTNTATYNAFLGVLCKGGQKDEILKFLHVMRSKRCFLDKSFYSTTIHSLSLKNKVEEATMVFDMMLQLGYRPRNTTYNLMISTYCYVRRIEDAYRLLDGMVWNEAFPDATTYNTIFQALIKAHKVEDGSSLFREMTRSEFDPDSDNLSMALVKRDLNVATIVWKHINQKGVFPQMGVIAFFVSSLCENGKRQDAKMRVEYAYLRTVLWMKGDFILNLMV
ncbi:hypothetical protein SUGI_0583070 [Cryptomeria japonica]|nr:hypothetical protein SUGI_0583070 [Cryptomeria japonica]